MLRQQGNPLRYLRDLGRLSIQQRVDFRKDLFEGQGVYTAGKKGCAAQMKYEGEWQGGDPHGRGTLQTIGGNTRTAVFDKELMDIKPKHADIDKVCG